MKTRKQGSTELFQFGPLFDENGPADLTGSTITIKMRDQYGAIVINDLPATPVLPSSGTYAPSAGDVANYGTFQVEITETKASGKVVRYPQSGYDPFIIEPKLDAIYVPPPTNPVNGSIGLALMASQTPGAVLLYDATGRPIAYAPVAAGRVLTDNGPGLPPTYQAVNAPVLIDSQTLAGAALYTSPTWAAGTYRHIRGVLKLSSWTHAQIRFAGIGAATGRTAGTRIAGTAFSDTTAMWLNFGASSPEIGIITFDLYPTKDTAPRGGSARTSAVDVATGLVTDMCNLNFQTTDLTTDITGILIDFLTTNATGTLRLYGETT